MKVFDIKTIVNRFIQSSNAFDVTTALTLFADDAEIIDVSVGKKFENITGVKNYLEEFFRWIQNSNQISIF